MFTAVEKIEDDKLTLVAPFAEVCESSGEVVYGLKDKDGDPWRFLRLSPEGELRVTDDISEQYIGFDSVKLPTNPQEIADLALEVEEDERRVVRLPLGTGGELRIEYGGGMLNPTLYLNDEYIGFVNHAESIDRTMFFG